MGCIGVDQQTWHPAKGAREPAAKAGIAGRVERIVLRGLLYAALALGVIGTCSPYAATSNQAVLVATVALAGLACSCRKPS